MNEKVQTLVDSLKPELTPVVKEIESGIKTTQNNYGRYMSLISMLSKGNNNVARIIGFALVECGANRAGVASALHVIGATN